MSLRPKITGSQILPTIQAERHVKTTNELAHETINDLQFKERKTSHRQNNFVAKMLVSSVNLDFKLENATSLLC